MKTQHASALRNETLGRVLVVVSGLCISAAALADPTTLILAAATQDAMNMPVPLNFPLTRSGDLGFDVALSYHTADGSAFAGIDYTAPSVPFIASAGSASTNIPVMLAARTANVGDLTFQLQLDAATGMGPKPSFAAQQAFGTGTFPYSGIATDVNGDGKPDIVITNSSDSTVSVLLNTTAPGANSASFAARQNFATGNSPYSVTAADVNGDAKPDLIVANDTDHTVSVLLNTTAPGATTSSFASQQTFATGGLPAFVTAADVDGDGMLDLIIANQGDSTVSILLNTTAPGAATPSFSAQQTFGTGATPIALTAGDFNGDGKPDLIIANFADNTLSVLLNTTVPGTTLTFDAQKLFDAGNGPLSASAVDVDGDGKADLIAANFYDNTVSVLLNTTAPGATTPSFAAQKTFVTGMNPYFVTAVDANGDGKPDLVLANHADNTVSVLLNSTAPGAATPSFAAQQIFDTGTNPSSVAAADFNGDGKPDLCVANVNDKTVSVLLNTIPSPTATLNFANAQQFSTGHAHTVVTADFDGDGKADLVSANSQDNSVSVLLNATAPGATTPSFQPQQTFAVGAADYSPAVGDFNGDGKPDIVVGNTSDNTISVLVNTTVPGATTPSFASQTTFPVGSFPISVAVADFNGDGLPDVVTANGSSNTVSVLFDTTAPGATVPTFTAQQTFATGSGPNAVATADLNGDGKPDLIVANYSGATVSVLLNTTTPGAATPSFAGQVTFATVASTHPFAIVARDLNGDGIPDIVVTNYSGTALPDSVSVLLNTTAPGAATPSFATQQPFATGAYAFSVAVSDLDGDGRPDVLVGNYLDSTISMLINTTAPGANTPSFAAQRTFYAAYPYSVAASDINGDGRPDIFVADAFMQTASVLLNTQYQATFMGSPATGTITHDTVFADGFE